MGDHSFGNGAPYQRLAAAVLRRAVLDLSDPGLPVHERHSAHDVLDGRSEACVAWCELAGLSPSAVARAARALHLAEGRPTGYSEQSTV